MPALSSRSRSIARGPRDPKYLLQRPLFASVNHHLRLVTRRVPVLHYVSESRGTCLHVSRYFPNIRSYPLLSPPPPRLSLPESERESSQGRTDESEGTVGERPSRGPHGRMSRPQRLKRLSMSNADETVARTECAAHDVEQRGVGIPCCSPTECGMWDNLRILPHAPRLRFNGHGAGVASVWKSFFHRACHVTSRCKRNLMRRQHYGCIDILGGLESEGASTCRWRCLRMVRATSFERSNGVIVAICTASETNRHRWHLASDRGGTSVSAAEDSSELNRVRSTRPRRYRGNFRTKAFGPRIYELPISATFYIARGGLLTSSSPFLIVECTHLGRVTASFGCRISVRDERGSATRTTCKPILYQSKQQTTIGSLQNLHARNRHDQGPLKRSQSTEAKTNVPRQHTACTECAA